MSSSPADAAVELAARDSYGRLLAWLCSRCGDVALAEDVLGDALEAALESWPDDGVPAKPEAWLLTVSKRRLIDRRRRAQTRTDNEVTVEQLALERLHREATEAQDTPFRGALPERRLELMFVCAHPEIPRNVRAALMLQTIVGMTADDIAQTMLVKPATLGQRLVRAKRRITDLGLPFQIPSAHELTARTKDVLEAIYAAYGAGWTIGADGTDALGLAGEAIWLARTLVELLPESAEAKGLYALLCFSEARRPARRVDGAYVPLDQQDTALWSHEMILEGEKALWMASRAASPGPFQLEAAIQSTHCHRARSGQTDWQSIASLYRVLVEQYPSIGSTVGYAASLGRVNRAAAGLAALDELPADEVSRYQPYWAVRSWLLDRLNRPEERDVATERAIGLTVDPAVRRWLLDRSQAPTLSV